MYLEAAMTVYKLTAYPKQVSLRDGRTVSVRPLADTDADALLKFFIGLPTEDRYFLKDDVTSPKVIGAWTSHRDFDRALPLVACANGEIVADATLIRSRHGAYRNLASVRVIVAPAYRYQGLGTALLHDLCDIAADAELDRVTAELVAGVQDDAIAATEQLGFIRAATVHELVRDEQGHPRDVAIMVLPLGKWYQWWQF
jgi:L-amino acid N-acyltransferase YncA